MVTVPFRYLLVSRTRINNNNAARSYTMSEGKTNSNYSPSRNKFNKYGSNITELREDLRKNFFQRLKINRNNHANKFRHILNSHHLKKRFETMVELKKLLYADRDASFDADRVLEEINEIENELLHKELEAQAEEYAQHERVENYLSKCVVCDDQITENVFCDNCTQQFLKEEF